jgi:Xaa-Pro dipeptidase
MNRSEEIEEKRRRLRSLLKELDLDAVYLKRQSNFAWLTAGGSNTVGITLELGVAGLLICPERLYAVCNNIEAPRMKEEERLEDLGYEIRQFPWYEDREGETIKSLSGGERVGADHPMPGLIDVRGRIDPLRYSLTEAEVERYRQAGLLTARAIEETAMTVRPGDRECAVIGRLAEKLWDNRLDYVTIFCAADERIQMFRHPIPTENRVKSRAMLCVNSRYRGLIVSLTRFVNFGKIPAEFRRRYDANVAIDCMLMANTIPGTPAVEAFQKGVATYAREGYPEEYRLHHQGGAIGYMGRDYKVDFRTKEIVRENQAFAWNPSITGSKSEDTMIATADGPLIVSPPVVFPVLKREEAGRVFARPDILEL